MESEAPRSGDLPEVIPPERGRARLCPQTILEESESSRTQIPSPIPAVLRSGPCLGSTHPPSGPQHCELQLCEQKRKVRELAFSPGGSLSSPGLRCMVDGDSGQKGECR